jgi:hypothetical protein
MLVVYCEVDSFCYHILRCAGWIEEFVLVADGFLWAKMRKP